MKALLAAVLFGAVSVAAQTTNVTASVVDSQSVSWASALYSLTFVPSNSIGKPHTTAGQFFTESYSGTADTSGNIAIDGVADINYVYPPHSNWNLCVTAAATGALKYCVSIPIQGTSQDVSSQINAVIKPPAIGSGPLIKGYADSEAAAEGGSMYFRLTDNSFRCYTTAWANCEGTGTAPLTLSTLGTDGLATFISGTLNVPHYAGSGANTDITSLADGTAATTQPAGDNTTKIATTAFVLANTTAFSRYNCAVAGGVATCTAISPPHLEAWGHAQLTSGSQTITGLPTFNTSVAQCSCTDNKASCSADLSGPTTLVMTGVDSDTPEWHCWQ